MNSKSVLSCCLVALLPALGFHTHAEPPASPNPAKIRIVLAGDSTVTDDAGWGKGFAAHLTGDVECINLSKGGRSSKSFIAEGRWKDALEKKPDYVLIQFGHNDQPGHSPERETNLETEYPKFMTQYVEEARAAGIKPVLITPMSRRQWGSDGKIHSKLQPWADAVRKIAQEKNVPLIDLHARSIELYEKLGQEGCVAISPLKPAKAAGSPSPASAPPSPGSASPPPGQVYDGTHLNAKGSELVGPLVVEGLKQAVPALSPYLK